MLKRYGNTWLTVGTVASIEVHKDFEWLVCGSWRMEPDEHCFVIRVPTKEEALAIAEDIATDHNIFLEGGK